MDQLRSALRGSDPVVGAWVSVGHPAVAEIAASLAFDFVAVDAEHAAVGIETVENLVRAVDAAGGETAPLARVAAADPVELKRVLDTGVAGVMVPRVDTAEAAREVVDATRYPPDGIRGVAAGRAARYGLAFEEYLDRADESIARVIQVETRAAVAAAGDIAAVEGVDALFVGPADLSAALDRPLAYDDERFRSAAADVVEAAHGEGVPAGVFVTDPGEMDAWLSLGFDFAIVGTDAGILVEGYRERLAAFEDARA